LHEVGTMIMRSNAREAGGAIFAATNIALGASILLVLIFEPRGLAHRWSVLKNTIQLWPFPHR
jgi:branched-chain amino acid transport system permease protein